MNVVKKLTLRHLKENKSRTVITTLGICVSVAMITAVFVSVASFINLFGELSIFSSGNQQAMFYDISQEQLKKLETDDRIKEIGCYMSMIENGENAFLLTDKVSNHTGTGDIYAGDETHLKQMITCKLDGEIPKNEHEILVEQELIEKNKLDWKIGDTVSFSVGERWYEESDGISYISGSYYSGEKFTETELREFKIVGILHGNNPTYSHKIVRGMSDEEKSGVISATISLKELNYKSLDELKDIVKTVGISEYRFNSDLLDANFAIDENSVLATGLIPIALIILVIIMIASVVLIYNAFGMSLSERTRYLGMLASVGATKKQKKQSVYFEGAILGAVGIPVGIIAGIIGIAITLKAVGSRIVASGMIMGIEDSGISMKTIVPVWAIIGIIFFSALTIFISSLIPAKKASAITPIEAIRQSKEFKVKAKKLKSPKYIRKIFGYEGEIAHKNLKRNGRKSRVITASIALSVVLFLSVNYFCQLFVQSADMEGNVPYQVEVVANYKDKERLLKDLSEIQDIDNIYSVSTDQYLYGRKVSNEADEGVDQSLVKDEVLTTTYRKLWNNKTALLLNIVDDEAFNTLCRENGIDYKDYYNGSKKCVVMNNINHKNNSAKVFTDKLIGEKIFYESAEEKDKVEICALVDYSDNNYLCRLNPDGMISAYIPESVYFDGWDNISVSLGIETEKHAEVNEKILNMVEEKNYSSVSTVDFVDSMEAMNTLVFVLQVFVYGFIVLITLITLANIINTISTSIDLRRKEFAMLKSVGTTQKGFYKMVNLESIFYGLKALVFGIPISIAVSVLMNKKIGSDQIPFEINWVMYIAVIAAVFLIVGLSMLYSVSKLKKDSIIETLKEDIS